MMMMMMMMMMMITRAPMRVVCVVGEKAGASRSAGG